MLANSPELYHNSCTLLPRSDTIRALPGRVAEWLNAAVLKTADASSVRGFESHPFRQNTVPCRLKRHGIFCIYSDFPLYIKTLHRIKLFQVVPYHPISFGVQVGG